MNFKKISNIDDFNHLMEEEEKFFFLKNSITCSLSQEAFAEVEKYASENERIPIYYLHVQESRDLSNEIAARFSVKHESPQMFVFEKGEVLWHDSHRAITQEALKEAWKK